MILQKTTPLNTNQKFKVPTGQINKLCCSQPTFGKQKKTKSYVIFSNETTHDKYSVYTFLGRLLIEIKKKYPEVEEINVFRDGAASQFKQQFLFCNLTFMHEEYGVDIAWHFFATRQGKGVVDGIGGAVKRSVWRACLAGKIITDATQLCEVATEKCKNIDIQFVQSAFPSQPFLFLPSSSHVCHK